MKIIHVSGKRKRAIARATLKPGKGRIRINKRLINFYTPELAKMKIMEPIILAGNLAKNIDIKVRVFGSGIYSQAEAIRLAIARGLVQFTQSKELKQKFLNYDRHLLIPDVRYKETCKPNDSGKARKKRQKSYR